MLLLFSFIVSFNANAYQTSIVEGGRVEFGVNEYIFAPAYISVGSRLTFDFNLGINTTPKLALDVEADISKLLNPKLQLTFEFNQRIISDFSFKNKFQIIKYCYGYIGYIFRNYSDYKVAEHNFYTIATLRLPVKNIFLFELDNGIAFKVMDFDTRDLLSTYYIDYNLNFFPLVQLGFHFFINHHYNIGFKVGNMMQDEPITLGSLAFELVQEMNVSREFNINFDMGVGFAGSGAVAGFPNRFWFAIGGSYVHWFSK